MLGFTPDFSHAFCKDRICTQLDIMYIIFTTYFYICLTGDWTWSMPLGKVCSRELPYLAITSSAQTTWRDFYGSPSSQAWGLDSAKLLDVASYEDWNGITYIIKETTASKSAFIRKPKVVEQETW